MMNHELRTPLNQILGYARLLETAPPGGEDPSSFECLKQIRASGEHLLSLVKRILEFSHLRSASIADIRARSFDIVDLLNTEIDHARKTASEKHITISADSIRRHVIVSADEDHIRLAVGELLSNAIKFSAAGGHISALIKCSDGKTALKIADSGCGLSEISLARLSTPFWQGDDTYSRQHEGVGLGLALVTAIAELNAVSFQIGQRPGGGAEATLIFDRVMPKASAA